MSDKAKRPTVADAMGRIDQQQELLNQIAGALGVTGDSPAPESAPVAKATPAAEAAPAEAKQTRTVRLPDLQTFKDEHRGIGVDATYSSNIAIFKLRDDGSPVGKKDGGVKKPTRLRVEDAEFILRHPEEISALCGQIRELQAQQTEASEEASA